MSQRFDMLRRLIQLPGIQKIPQRLVNGDILIMQYDREIFKLQVFWFFLRFLFCSSAGKQHAACQQHQSVISDFHTVLLFISSILTASAYETLPHTVLNPLLFFRIQQLRLSPSFSYPNTQCDIIRE